jgi:hypothetical protein
MDSTLHGLCGQEGFQGSPKKTPPFQALRQSRRKQILYFFQTHLGTRFATAELHERFGTSFRTRVSELNRDVACPIKIRNEVGVISAERGQLREQSVYWAEPRIQARRLSDADKSDYMRRAHEEEAKAFPLFAGLR